MCVFVSVCDLRVRRAAALLPSAVPSQTVRESTAQGPNVQRCVRMKIGAESRTSVSTESFRFMKKHVRICVPSAHVRTRAYAMFRDVIR